MSSSVCDGAKRPRMNGPFPAEYDLFVFERNLELNEAFLDLGLNLGVIPGLSGPGRKF